jgi:hypothetical protein
MFLHRSPAGIELSKVQAQLVDGGNAWTKCQATVPNYLDNNWHHVAGVISTTGMRIYFDGAQVASNPDGTSIVYPLGTDFFVGRHGNGDAGFDYDGNIDDVRIYDRALSDSEILQLSLGGS